MTKLWFRRKRYGWGWIPCSWEGWLVLFAWSVFFITNTIKIARITDQTQDVFPRLFLVQIFSIAILLVISYWKGEAPKWQWGEQNDKK